MLIETRRAERGHDFYPPANVLASVPALYDTEQVPAEDKTVHLHYFVADCDWWIAELDPDSGLAFGYLRLHGDDANAEWGYVSLPELEAIYQPGQVRADTAGRPVRILPRLIVERDLGWRAASFDSLPFRNDTVAPPQDGLGGVRGS